MPILINYIVDHFPVVPLLPHLHDPSYCFTRFNEFPFRAELHELSNGTLSYTTLARRHKFVHMCIQNHPFVTITLTTNNQPQYLQVMLQTLKAAYERVELSKKRLISCLYIFCEPNQECIDICNSIDWIPNVRVHVNSVKMGVRKNPYQALDYVFNSAKSPFNLHLEDDLLIHPNALRMFLFFYDRFKSSLDTFFVYELFQYTTIGNQYKNYHDQYKVLIKRTGGHFVGLGWATTMNTFNKHMKDIWFKDLYPDPLNTGRMKGWNWTLSQYMISNNLKHVVAAYPHTKHIGKKILGPVNPPPQTQTHVDGWVDEEDFEFIRTERYKFSTGKFYVDGVDNIGIPVSLIVL